MKATQPRARTFRVFVSSTFSDLKAERNALQDHVFPKLRALCLSHGCRFQAIDLRWGVSEEASRDQQAINLCLSELKRCQTVSPRPNFIVLLGNRYGAQPLPAQVEAAEFESLLAQIPPDEQARVCRWYHRDDNAVPPEYVLLPRERGSEFEDRKVWGHEEHALLASFRRAAEKVFPDQQDERRNKYFQSATHQEIQAGALAESVAEAGNHVACWFREFRKAALVGKPPADVQAFVDLNPDGSINEQAWQAQEALKTGLRDRLPEGNLRIEPAAWPKAGSYQPSEAALQAMCDFFLEKLTAIIETEVARLEKVPAAQLENEDQRKFAEERARHFQGRADTLEQIRAYLHGADRHPLIVHGVSGSGKTALMAKAWLDAQAGSPDMNREVGRVTPCAPGLEPSDGGVHGVTRPTTATSSASDGVRGGQLDANSIIGRFAGATPGSTQLHSLLADLCRQISAAYGVPEEIPDDLNKLIDQFRYCLFLARAERPLVLFLDALDQITDLGDRPLSWLPGELPEHARVVVSVLERANEPAGRCYDFARSTFTGSTLVPVLPLAGHDGEALLDCWLQDAGRAVTPAQRAAILTPFQQTGLPLWLKLAFEEARRWKSFTPAAQTTLPADTLALIRRMLDQLTTKQHHSALLVNRALGYLAAARRGLSEDELLEVLALDEDYWKEFSESARHDLPAGTRRLPVIVWSRLYHDLAAYLSEQSVGGTLLLSFYHRSLREAVAAECLKGDELRAGRLRLAGYFEKQTINPRKADELPWLLHAAEAWDRLEVCLTDIPLFLALYNDKTKWELTGYWHPLRRLGRDLGECYTNAYTRWSAAPANAGDHLCPSYWASFCLTTASIHRPNPS